MPWGSKIPLSTAMASATASPAGTFSMASAASPDTRAASSGPPAIHLHRSENRFRLYGNAGQVVNVWCVQVQPEAVKQLAS